MRGVLAYVGLRVNVSTTLRWHPVDRSGATIVIGDNVPNAHECGGQGDTKLLGDPILYDL